MSLEAAQAALLRLELATSLLLGATVGSFLNVVIARVPAGESVVHPRSRCPRCRAPIAWYDNLPILSWLLLRGRCRGCALPISIRYPVVELLGAGLGWMAWQRHGLTTAALAEFAFTCLLLALAAIDLDTWLLPHALTWPLIGGGLLAAALGLGAASSFASSAWGAGIGFVSFGLVAVVGERVLKKEALGLGDVWLLAGLGAWLGALALLPVVLLASTQGALAGLALMAAGKAQPGPAGPDGPGLAPALADAGAAPPGLERPEAPTSGTVEEATAEGGAPPSATPATAAPAGPGEVPAAEPTAPPEDPDADWVPPKNAVPFGPFLVAAALEWLWFGGPLARAITLFQVFR